MQALQVNIRRAKKGGKQRYYIHAKYVKWRHRYFFPGCLTQTLNNVHPSMDHRCTLFRFPHDIKLGGPADTLKGRAATQGDLEMPGKTGQGEPYAIQKGQNAESCGREGKFLAATEVSLLKRTKALCQTASSTGALSAEMAARSLDCVNKEPWQLIKGRDRSPLASIHWTTSGYCSPSPGRTLINQREFSKRQPTPLGMKHLTCGKSWGNRLAQPESRDSIGSTKQQPHHHSWRGHLTEEAKWSKQHTVGRPDTKTEMRDSYRI